MVRSQIARSRGLRNRKMQNRIDHTQKPETEKVPGVRRFLRNEGLGVSKWQYCILNAGLGFFFDFAPVYIST